MNSYPILNRYKGIEVSVGSYGESPKYLVMEFILDFNQFKELIGIEILSFKAMAGKHVLNKIKSIISSTGDGLRYAYDEESDSFYLQLSRDRSVDQLAVDGTLILNEREEVVGFKVQWSE